MINTIFTLCSSADLLTPILNGLNHLPCFLVPVTVYSIPVVMRLSRCCCCQHTDREPWVFQRHHCQVNLWMLWFSLETARVQITHEGELTNERQETEGIPQIICHPAFSKWCSEMQWFLLAPLETGRINQLFYLWNCGQLGNAHLTFVVLPSLSPLLPSLLLSLASSNKALVLQVFSLGCFLSKWG